MARKTGASRRRSVVARHRGQQAINLRMAGATLEQIASLLGFATAAGVYKAIMRELGQSAQETGSTEAARQLSLKRLDEMLLHTWPRVLSGDQGAVKDALRIEERRAFLMGLDAPKQIEARIRVDVISWNQALRDFIDIYRQYHHDSPEAPLVLDSLDKLGQERFAGMIA